MNISANGEQLNASLMNTIIN